MSTEPSPLERVQIAPRVRHALRAHAQEPFCRELCGVVFGTRDAAVLTVAEFDLLPNRALAPAGAFHMDAMDVLAARRLPLCRVGFWHTHADVATPSAADRRSHEQFLRVIPGRLRPERLLLVVAPSGVITSHWFEGVPIEGAQNERMTWRRLEGAQPCGLST